MAGIPPFLTQVAPKTFTPPPSMTGANPSMAGSGSASTPSVQDTSALSPQAQAVADAQAMTARRDTSLTNLAKGPVVVNGQEISQKDGYRAVSDASWDRFQGAYSNLPDGAKSGIAEQMTVVQLDWIKEHGAARFNQASPEVQKELTWSWQAQAAGNYGRSAGAQGSPADLTHLADGARQYLEARAGYLEHGGTIGQ